MSEIWYLVRKCTIKIEEVEVLRNTDKTIWIKVGKNLLFPDGIQKSPIESSYYTHYPSREDAITHLIERESNRLSFLKSELQKAENNLKEINQL